VPRGLAGVSVELLQLTQLRFNIVDQELAQRAAWRRRNGHFQRQMLNEGCVQSIYTPDDDDDGDNDGVCITMSVMVMMMVMVAVVVMTMCV
jgi:hypothetical protein